jgi:superfamily II DNA or RNA helicase
MSEALSLASEELRHRDAIEARLDVYDSMSVEAEHLRLHQAQAVNKFREVASDIIQGNRPNQGMSLLHPTGSGKTVTASEIIRIFASDIPDIPKLKVLMLVPGYQVLNQTTGNLEEPGVVQAFDLA